MQESPSLYTHLVTTGPGSLATTSCFSNLQHNINIFPSLSLLAGQFNLEKKYKKIDVKKAKTLFPLYEINEKNFERNHKMEIEIFSIASEKYKSWFKAKMGLTYTEFFFLERP